MNDLYTYEERYYQDINSIIFNCRGALDFSEQIYIELSLESKKDFTQIHPLDLLQEIHIDHLSEIIDAYFFHITKKVPHISDKTESIALEKRFHQIFYKCYRKYLHSHEIFKRNGYPHYKYLSLTEAVNQIKSKHLSIKLPNSYPYALP